MGTNTSRIKLTASRVEAFSCPSGKSQAFLWDTAAPSLMVRSTPTGRKTYAFEGRLNGQTIRIGIGSTADWTLDKARQRAAELQMLVDNGQDPRELQRQQQAAREAQRIKEEAQAVTMGEVWAVYLVERRPHWGERHYRDQLNLTKAGGQTATRGTRGRGVTIAGPLHQFLTLPLRELTPERLDAWAVQQAKTRPTVARLSLRCLKAFLNWCADHPTYKVATHPTNAASSKKARQALGKSKPKSDALLREQLPDWFRAVREISNPTVSAYLQCLLLVGCRPGEMLALRWEDIDWKWRGLTIRDKVEGERVIPLTPYVSSLIFALPRRNGWVFASNRTNPDKPEGAPLTDPNHAHDKACKAAGLDDLTLHGLRRSFKSLTEWLEIPAGVVAQIMGHKPSATAEKHYTVRPLDLLRVHHERIESWILEQAQVQFDAKAEPVKLRVAA